MTQWRLVWVSFFFIYSAAMVQGQRLIDTTGLGFTIDSILDNAIDSGAFPGAQVMAFYQGELICHRIRGFHTYDSVREVRGDDVYDLASITKAIAVTAALMKLVGEDRFDLDATVADYYKPFRNSNKKDLTWRQILAHNAGLYPWIAYWESTIRKNGKYKCRTFKYKPSKKYPIEITDSLYLHRNYYRKIVKAIKKSPVYPDTGYLYSGLAFYILPEIITRITGEAFEQFLKSNIYKPVGADSITYNPLQLFSVSRIIPTERDTFFRKSQIQGRVHDEGAAMMGGVSGNAGLFSKPMDLARIALLLYNQGVYGKDTILQPRVVEEFTRCQYCEEGNRRGLGFDKPPWHADPLAESVTVCQDASASSFGHSGYTGTLMWIDPENELIYLFFSNRVYPTRFNTEINDMKIRPKVHQVIYDAIKLTGN